MGLGYLAHKVETALSTAATVTITSTGHGDAKVNIKMAFGSTGFSVPACWLVHSTALIPLFVAESTASIRA